MSEKNDLITGLLSRLTPGGGGFEIRAPSGGKSSITASDVSAALAFGCSYRGALALQAKYLDDQNARLGLIEALELRFAYACCMQGWQTNHAAGVAFLVAYRYLAPDHCVHCHGTGRVARQTVMRRAGERVLVCSESAVCAKCHGTGRREMRLHEQAALAGMQDCAYRRYWRDRADALYHDLLGWERQGIVELTRQFRNAA